MAHILVIVKEENIRLWYVEDLKDAFDASVVSPDNLEEVLLALNQQKFDLILLVPDLWDKGQLDQVLSEIESTRKSDSNVKLFVMSCYTENPYSFADAFWIMSAEPEWLLKACDLLGIEKEKGWVQKYHMNTIYRELIKRDVKIFICYAKENFDQVHEVYKALEKEGYSPWMDKENIVGGQDWDLEITKAIESSNFFVACLSKYSVSREGYVQKELKKGLEVLERQPEGRIYLIPLRFDNCKVPERFKRLQYVDLLEPDGMGNLLKAVRRGCEQRQMSVL